MNRRRVLQYVGVGAVIPFSGCSRVQQVPTTPDLFEQSIDVTDATCEEQPEHNTAVEFLSEDSEIVATGSIVSHGSCESLRLSVFTEETGPHSDEVWLRITPKNSIDDCEPCPARLQYIATVTFSTGYFPSAVDIIHKESPDGGIEYAETFDR